MKLSRTFDFYPSMEEAQRAADNFNAMHPGWKKHRASVTPWEQLDGKGDAHAICWTWR